MRIFSVLLLLFVFGLITNAQTPSKKALEKELLETLQLEKVVYKYDKFKDRSLVTLQTQIFGKPQNGLLMGLFADFKGSKPTDTPLMGVVFTSANQTRLYDKDRSLIILADNQRLTLNEINYISAGSSTKVEAISYLISKAELMLMERASNVEMQLRTTEFVLNGKQKLLIRDFEGSENFV